MIGETISHYRILSKLGEGGMGVVYRAEDLTLGRTVALKFLPPDSVARSEDRTRLVHEARAAAALLHPNICPIHEIAESEGRTFIAMAHIEGRSLKDRISEGPLPVSEALSIARQLAEALACAHAGGVVHRDVKPGNVMLARDGRPMLMDFGLAKVSGATKLTRTGTTMGTVAYMSPEQVEGKETDHRGDIWALGVVLYEMVSGRLPFSAAYEAALLYSILNEEPALLSGEGSSIPTGLDGIIAKALSKDPDNRYQNAREMAADLDSLARDSAATPAGRAAPPARGMKRVWRRWKSWQRAAAVVSVAVIVAAACVALFRLWPSAPEAANYSLAIMDFRDLATPDDPTVSAGLTELVNCGLTESSPIRVISSERLHDLRRRHFGSARGAIEDSQMLEIARAAEATIALVATISKSGANLLGNWRMVDVRKGHNLGAGRVEGNTLATLADQIIAAALPQITRFAGAGPTEAAATVASLTTESPRAYQHYMAGLLAAEEGRTDEAVTQMEKAVAIDSTFALAYHELSKLSNRLAPGAWLKASSYARKASSLKSRLGLKDQMRVDALLEDLDGSTGRSIAILEEARKRWPDDREVLGELAAEMFHWWDWHGALRVAEEGRKLYPDDPNFNASPYSALLLHTGRTGEALGAARSWAIEHADQPDSWSWLGWVFLVAGMPDSAEAAYRRAVELDAAWQPENFSYCAFQRGDVKGAIKTLEAVIARKDLKPDLKWSLTFLSPFNPCLAFFYIEAGQYKKVRDMCRAQISSEGYASAPIYRLLIVLDRAEEVRAMWAKEDQAARSYPRPLGRALAALGDAKGAREAADSLLKVEVEHGKMARYDAYEISARAALADRNPKSALMLLQKMKESGVIRGGYIDIDYRTALATAYRMNGQLDKAVAVHKEMLRIYGGHALSHYELGQIYEQMKRPAEAKREYAQFLEMWSSADKDLPQYIDARKRLAGL